MQRPAPARARETPFALFVSSVEGHTVSRYGTATGAQANELIGARRQPGGGIVWDVDAICALTERELDLFRREYLGAIAAGALRERTETEYLDAGAAQKKRAREVVERERLAREAAEAAEAAPASTPDVDSARSTDT